MITMCYQLVPDQYVPENEERKRKCGAWKMSCNVVRKLIIICSAIGLCCDQSGGWCSLTYIMIRALGPPNMYNPPVTLTEGCLCIFPWFCLLYGFLFLFELNWFYVLFQRDFLRMLLVVILDQVFFSRHYLAISRRHGISFRFGCLFFFGATKCRGGGGPVKTGGGVRSRKKGTEIIDVDIYIYLSN